jgi:succinoglycan biosynthesis protein ExoO
LQYDLRLRIAEDYDLVARALAAGARYRFLPAPTYFYRRHAASTSHRQCVADLSGMLRAADAAATGSSDPELLKAVAMRTAGIRSASRHATALDALKARRPLQAARALGADGGAWRLMRQTFVEGGGRRLRRTRANRDAAEPAVLVIGAPSHDPDVARAVERLEREGRPVVHRDRPADDRARALLADGLPPLTHVFVAPPATPDDAAYALAPSLARGLPGTPLRSHSVNAA